MKHLLLFFFFSIAMGIAAGVARAEPPHDTQTTTRFAEFILAELKTGQFDALESQYQDFRDQEHQRLPDGTPKSWIYFWAFEVATTNSPFEDSQDFTQKIRQWLAVKPYSVPALLALENSLLGECEHIRNQTIEQHRDINDPETAQQLQDRVDEITKVMQAVPSDKLPDLVAEPQYSAGLIHTYILTTAGYDRFSMVDRDLQSISPTYVPYYSQALVWLSYRRRHDPSLRRPEVFLTDRLKPSPLDSDEEAKRKSEAYAQVIAFTSPDKAKFDPSLVDRQTLKAGLKNLVQDYGTGTDWASRLLLTSFQEKDRGATKEAFAIVGDSFSPEVISPVTYEQIAKWLEQG